MQMIHKATAAVAFQAIVHYYIVPCFKIRALKFEMVIAAATLTQLRIVYACVSAVCSAHCDV